MKPIWHVNVSVCQDRKTSFSLERIPGNKTMKSFKYNINVESTLILM